MFSDSRTRTFLPGSANVDGDTSILSGLSLALLKMRWGMYTGPLPFNIDRNSTQEQLRARVGEPSESDEELCWDEWIVDGLELRIAYTDTLDSIKAVNITYLRHNVLRCLPNPSLPYSAVSRRIPTSTVASFRSMGDVASNATGGGLRMRSKLPPIAIVALRATIGASPK